MRVIKVFLASSSELKPDREQFEIHINRLNQFWVQKGFFLELVVWENFLDAMTADGLQDSYNKAIAGCDIFVMLFFTKVGIYTEEEFETAFGNFKNTGKPFVYTFFKNGQINIGDVIKEDLLSLFSFQEKLRTLKHYFTTYTNIEDLKLRFSEQLNKLINGGHIRESLVDIDPLLKQLLEQEKSFCKAHNIYMYAANILNAVLQNKEGVLVKALNSARKGYSELLAIKLRKIIQSDFIEKGKSKPFFEQDWFDREDIKSAKQYAEKENEKFINERHLILGIIEQQGSTVKMIRQDLQEEEWVSFFNNISFNNLNSTPITTI